MPHAAGSEVLENRSDSLVSNVRLAFEPWPLVPITATALQRQKRLDGSEVQVLRGGVPLRHICLILAIVFPLPSQDFN